MNTEYYKFSGRYFKVNIKERQYLIYILEDDEWKYTFTYNLPNNGDYFMRNVGDAEKITEEEMFEIML